MGEITGGELLLRSLHAEGVRHVWAIPDGTYMIFLGGVGGLCARAEGSPVVAITTTRRSDIAYPHLGGMQVLDQEAYFSPAVKWSAQGKQWKRRRDIVHS